MSVILDIEMPKACAEFHEENNETTLKYCPIYRSCEHRDTINTNNKPLDCPLYEMDNEIRVGDEVLNENHIRYVVTGIKHSNYEDCSLYLCVDSDGDCASIYYKKSELKKTGRNFPQISEVLKKMKELNRLEKIKKEKNNNES